ncbi:MAG TPA: hypothetical protein VJ276_06745 [Thermoanaerobaculia bacterium]|nr:hypothetical protein [Thermoanaerobaculia bacterium]
MSFLPTLTFTGIDLLTIDNAARMVYALLPDGSNNRIARNVDDAGRPVIIPEHLAYVRFELDDLDPALAAEQRKPDIIFQARGKTYGVCFLRHESVDVEGPFETDGVTFESSLATPSPQPSSADRLTFNDYVVEFAAACPDCTPVDRRYTDPASDEAQTRLAAIVRLTRGHFAASHVNASHVWTFDHDARRQPFHRLAQEVPVTFQSRENRFSLRFASLRPLGDPAASVLHFARQEGQLDVRVGNAPLPAILLQTECIEENVDYHFELYYDLYPQRREMPRIPRKRIVGKEPHASNCPLVRGQLADPPSLAAAFGTRSAIGAASTPTLSASRTFAIHLGVGGIDPLADLDAWRDVTAMYDHQVILPNSACTTGALRRAIDDAGTWLRDGGLLFVTFSGHAAIYPRLYDRMLNADELRALWSNFNAGVRIVFLSDSCHSGAAVSTGGVAADVLLLAACDGNGVAYEGAARDEASFFTAMMKRAIDESPGATLRSQFERAAALLREIMRELPVRQTPKWTVVSGDEVGFDRLVMF